MSIVIANCGESAARMGLPRRLRSLGAAFCAGVGFVTAAAGQSPDPEHLAIPREYVTAHNAPDTMAMYRFVDKYYPTLAADRRLGVASFLVERRATFGRLTAARYYSPMQKVAAVVVRAAADDYWYRIDFLYEVTPVLRVRGIATPASSPLEAMATEPFSLAREVAALRAFIHAEAVADRFSGVVAVRHAGKLLLEVAEGMADRETGRPVTQDTPFRLASTAKLFTATAVMRLVEQGRIDLDAPVGRYLPAYPNPHVRDSVTVGMLLTHTAGLGDIFSDQFLTEARPAQTLTQVSQYFATDSLEFAPGSRYGYSNAGFVVLGLIVEAVNRSPFPEAIRDLVLRPAGAKKAGWRSPYEATGRTAIPYTTSEEAGHPLIRDHESDSLPPTTAGDGVATVADLLAFDAALWGGRLLTASGLRELTKGRVARGPLTAGRQAYGIYEVVVLGQQLMGHNGGAPGVLTDYYHAPATGDAMVLLANVNNRSAEQVEARVLALLARLSARSGKP
jgi:CubicO group peptidase (beta-lactamase class C family)